jgi:glycine dehydrogenase subunit 1
VPISYGGPAVGLFAAKKELVRRMPGRIAARTSDGSGKIGYVLTLQTREQHIRREKATSNICTNQGLMATLSTVFMSLVGKEGLLQMARLSYAKAHYAASLLEAKGFTRAYSAPFFKEFALELPVPASKVVSRLKKSNIVPGIDLGKHDKKRKNQLLIAVTEKKLRADIESLAEGMSFFRPPAGSGIAPERRLEAAGQV